MADTVKKTPKQTEAEHEKELEEYHNEKVPVMVRRPEGIKDNFCTVTINGINYQIEYGKEVLVPRSVKFILDEAERNRERAEERSAQMIQDFASGKASLGER